MPDLTTQLAEFAGCVSDFDATAQATAQAAIDPAVPDLLASPVIAIAPDGTQLSAYVEVAFLVRDLSPDGQTGIIGTNGVLWRARLAGNVWTTSPVTDQGEPVYAERPVLAGNGAESLLVFRRFGQANNNSRYGQLATSQIMNEKASAPLYITDERAQKWQASAAINPLNGAAAILSVTRNVGPGVNAANADASLATTAIASSQALPLVESTVLSTAADPVGDLTLSATADPALDPLLVTNRAPAPGEIVTVTVVVRNVGRNNATSLTLRLFAGIPGSSAPLGNPVTPGALGFNATFTAQFAVTGNGGNLPLYAEVTTTGENAVQVNHRASLTLGVLSAPTVAGIIPSPEFENSVTVVWSDTWPEYVTGYRILRGATEAGPFEVIGEAVTPPYNDAPVVYGKSYCYQVQAYNGNTVSPASRVVCGGLPAQFLYLPVVLR